MGYWFGSVSYRIDSRERIEIAGSKTHWKGDQNISETDTLRGMSFSTVSLPFGLVCYQVKQASHPLFTTEQNCPDCRLLDSVGKPPLRKSMVASYFSCKASNKGAHILLLVTYLILWFLNWRYSAWNQSAGTEDNKLVEALLKLTQFSRTFLGKREILGETHIGYTSRARCVWHAAYTVDVDSWFVEYWFSRLCVHTRCRIVPTLRHWYFVCFWKRSKTGRLCSWWLVLKCLIALSLQNNPIISTKCAHKLSKTTRTFSRHRAKSLLDAHFTSCRSQPATFLRDDGNCLLLMA